MDSLARLTVLYECTRALGVQRDIDALLDDVLARAQELLGCEHCALLLFDAERGQLELRRARGFGERRPDILGLKLSLGSGLSGMAAARREALRVDDVRGDSRYVPGLEGARSNLAVPLLVRNELVGVLNAESLQPNAFTAEHEKLCTVLGTQAALAIEASRSRERLEQRLREIDTLYRISRLASEPCDLRGVLQGILDAAAVLLPEGPMALYLCDGDGDELVVRASRGPGAPREGSTPAAGESSSVRRCMRSGQAVLVSDISARGAAATDCDTAPGSEVAAPLRVDGRVAGVLYAATTHAHAFTREHGRSLARLAQQSALVLGAARMRAQLHRLATTDALTGLYNRRHFMGELEDHLRRLRRYGGRLGVAVFDLDGFKQLNDRHGHAAGDRALQAIAGLMRGCLRDSDVVARLGGDEFAALLLEADPDEAGRVIERLRGEVEAASLQPTPVTLSAGLALFPQHGNDSEGLLHCADAALYTAKRRGRNCVVSA